MRTANPRRLSRQFQAGENFTRVVSATAEPIPGPRRPIPIKTRPRRHTILAPVFTSVQRIRCGGHARAQEVARARGVRHIKDSWLKQLIKNPLYFGQQRWEVVRDSIPQDFRIH